MKMNVSQNLFVIVTRFVCFLVYLTIRYELHGLYSVAWMRMDVEFERTWKPEAVVIIFKVTTQQS
jgi:hypothetical protein